MAIIYDFKKAEKVKDKKAKTVPSSPISLNDIKIRLIEYFSEYQITHVNLKPVNLACPYEPLILKVCQVFLQAPPAEDLAMQIAEVLYSADVRHLKLADFLNCINQDDLLLACLQTELPQMKQVDLLFLTKVLESKFPKEQAVMSLLKAFLFARDQSHRLETHFFAAPQAPRI